MKPYYEGACVLLHLGDCRDVMGGLPDASVDAIVTDPPYELGFMGKAWDGSGIAYSVPMWREALRVLKPGGHLAAFGGTRTYHRMASAIEDAGFEVRDCLAWMYGSGFPKSLDVSKAIDKAAGAEREVLSAHRRGGRSGGILGAATEIVHEVSAPATDAARQWDGWGTALKPAYEPIVLARKPLSGTVAANVTAYGTGVLNIDACRIEGTKPHREVVNVQVNDWEGGGAWKSSGVGSGTSTEGRWPANVLLDEEAAAILDEQAGNTGGSGRASGPSLEQPYDGARTYGARLGTSEPAPFYGDHGGPSRFFYTAKSARSEREAGVDVEPARRADADSRADDAPGSNNPRLRVNERRNDHPTVKPVNLMRWLCRLVTPPGGLILDPFNGSGTTGMAALDEGFRYLGIEREERYCAISVGRITHRHVLDVETKPATPERVQGVLL